jgi:hypothetical protein
VGKIRLAGPGDAAALLALQRRLDTQSSFMLLERQERERAPGQLRAGWNPRAWLAASTSSRMGTTDCWAGCQ